MPGHKGESFLGIESLDITEIDGADSLYEACGIIAESEKNASALFGCDTFYSTEGSSQCIRAMLYLAQIQAKKDGKKPLIAAGRNAHKAFHSALALLDIDVEWLYPQNMENYLSCNISADELTDFLRNAEQKPTAVYLTSPDYLGNMADISAISKVCRENDILLLVDNAHGAYLRFLPKSEHPMDLGADICCDSAHKTLPVLTGGAYLHISDRLSDKLSPFAKNALSLFGSTSPSYLILQSLDAANAYLDGYSSRLADFAEQVGSLKARLVKCGYSLYGDEPLKITVQTKSYGYSGYELEKLLADKGITCEFGDPDFVVLMLTAENTVQDLQKLESAMISIPRREAIEEAMPKFHKKSRSLSVREAMLSPSETITASEALGRVAAMTSVACPPAVPIVVSGEIIDSEAIECFAYYGTEKCNVVCKE